MKKIIILISILLFACFLRFYKISDYPQGVHIDEAAFGYNAYSILKTGADQFGNKLPLIFESEGDYKLPVHVYLSTIPIALFGLNDFSVRLTTAVMGIGLIFAIFLIVKGITLSDKKAILSSFIFAVSPWPFIFSRQGTEVVTSAFFSAFSLVFYIKFDRFRKLRFFYLFLISAFIAMLTYRTASLFIMIFYLILLAMRFKSQNIVTRKYVLSACALIVIVFLVLSSSLLKRYSDLNILNSDETKSKVDLNLREDGMMRRRQENYFIPRIFHNKPENLFLTVQENFWSQLDFSKLFFKTETQNNSIPNMGNLYFFEVIFLVIYMFYTAKLTSKNNLNLIPVLWIFSSIVPSAFASDAVNTSRTMQSSIGFVMAISFGIFSLKKELQKHELFLFIYKSAIVFAYCFGLMFMIHQYFIHKPQRMPWYRDVGVKKAVEYIEANKAKYQKVIFGNDIFTIYAFRANSDPRVTQENVKSKSDNGQKRQMKNIDKKFETDNKNCNLKQGEENVLYVCFGRKIPENGKILLHTMFEDMQPNITLYEYVPNTKIKLPINMEFYQ